MEPKYYDSGTVDVKFGEGVTVVRPTNLYGCEIGEECFVGPFVEIQKGVKVGARTRVQSHSFLCEGVTVGEDCFVGHGVMFVNDLFSEGEPSPDPADWKDTIIGNNVSIGSNVTLLPVSVCDGCVIGAGSVVTRDLTEKGVYAGNPARLVRKL